MADAAGHAAPPPPAAAPEGCMPWFDAPGRRRRSSRVLSLIVLPRAVPMVEAMTALVLVDHALRHHAQCE